MAKPAPRSQTKANQKTPLSTGLVAFSYQDVAYHIDVAKSKVYRRFIEIEKSKQFSIMSAYRGTRPTA